MSKKKQNPMNLTKISKENSKNKIWSRQNLKGVTLQVLDIRVCHQLINDSFSRTK